MMMKKICLTLALAAMTALAGRAQVTLNEENFPDEVFRNLVSEKFDTDGDGSLSEVEIAAVKNVSFIAKNITSLKGIEHFTSLTRLLCLNCKLTTLDLSANTALTQVQCSNNPLTALNVAGCTALTTLSCNFNLLTELDVSTNTALTSLSVSGNHIGEAAMNALAESLPTVTSGTLEVIESGYEDENNVCSTVAVQIAKEKGWKVVAYDEDSNEVDYEGSEPTLGIRPIENGEWTMDNGYFTLDGRKLPGKPTAAGVYVTGGRKVVVK